MSLRRGSKMFLLTALFLFCAHPAAADVSPGDVIDKTNWEKAEGLLPEAVLNWVKKGDAVLDIGELTYDPKDYIPPGVQASLEANKGKYDLDENDLIVDAKTGKEVGFFRGLPFPDVLPDDPKFPQKWLYNRSYYPMALGNTEAKTRFPWIGRKTGYEREMVLDCFQYMLTGYSPAKNEKNPQGIQFYQIMQIVSPFDIAGTALLLWRFINARPDNTFAYVPTIRRVRRMSPANRSDAWVGSDFCADDAWGFDGKVGAFEWRLLRRQEALFPFTAASPQAFIQMEGGRVQTSNAMKPPPLVLGYQKEGWQGAPWMPTNAVWVKRPVYVFEVTAKDPYYNYGVQYMWVDAEHPHILGYKVIHDRANNYWKIGVVAWGAFETHDRTIRSMLLWGLVAVDERSDHATVPLVAHPPNCYWAHFCEQNRNMYSLGGFQSLCK